MTKLIRKSRSKGQRYTVTLGPRLEDELANVADVLSIPKSEAIRRALTLYKHAVEADNVVLKKGQVSQTVLVK